MRRVPHYLLIGDGRVAKHFKHYFSLLQLPFSTWNRQQSVSELKDLLPQSSHLLILISDAAIEAFVKDYCANESLIRIHFSGSLISQHAFGAHPLMSFANEMYSLQEYQTIPFVLDDDAPEFSDLLPGLANSHFRLDKTLKAKYHALCVLSGNFSCLLWQKLFSEFEQKLNLPQTISHPYLRQQMQNLVTNPLNALTGPLVRNDIVTIENNLAALCNDPFQEVYQSFVNAYKKLNVGE